ncbi:hypothetical protein X474_26055 [Dethiosulfatarculus sandiegensis]|uniref:Uncharacterized protein n=1 Tax=Dethiosulfatarculus sandiegensis TaxID=1429043 RepID=A0A0D2HKS5_9BACT|nr:hypothetical protein X474_26055 [Dethiosulfatarculus sandiegensis]
MRAKKTPLKSEILGAGEGGLPNHEAFAIK